MRVPLRWLKEFVEVEVDPQSLANRLTMAGLAVEKIEKIGSDWERIYVGYVHAVRPHPDADRLVLADVEAGEHRLTVVTGAPNIAAGQRVALALAGARLIDGYGDSGRYKILKPGRIRGVLSEGMACSEKELGLSSDHEGVLVLADDAPVGAQLAEYLGDTVLEFEITPNLVHDFSVWGIGRETAALYDKDVQLPDMADFESLADLDDSLVEIEAVDLCSRYIGIVLDGVTVEPSPQWLQLRLKAAGLRPINNVVDVTNYVMLEFGQPLHAFDRDRLEEGRIVVRRPKRGEILETIDHVRRELGPEMLLIADASSPVAIAGVMGGADSEVHDGTTSLLLEGAKFDMKSVRHTSRALKLRTDASTRFERGLDPNLAGVAMKRAVKLLLEVCPTSRVTSYSDVYPRPSVPRPLTMDYDRIEKMLGIAFPERDVLRALGNLEFEPSIVIADGKKRLTVTVPTYRQDVSIPEDIVEEVARVSGYDLLPATLPTGRTVGVHRDPEYLLERRMRSILTGSGLTETVSYVTVSETMLRATGTPDSDQVGVIRTVKLNELIRLKNPLQADRPFLRTMLVPSLLEIAAANLKHRSSVKIFELARLYLPNGTDNLPTEVHALGLVMAGDRERLSIFKPTGEFDFFDLKGVIDEVLMRAGIAELTFEHLAHPAFHPGRCAAVSAQGARLAVLGEVHPTVAEYFGITDRRVAAAEVDLDAVLKMAGTERAEVRVLRFLPVEQDFAVTVDEPVTSAEVEETLRQGAGSLLTAIQLFDIYRGPQLGEGKKSLAYRLTFTAPDRALTDSDLTKIRTRIQRIVAQRVNGQLRV